MKLVILFFFYSITTMAQTQFSVFHYNIKELDSAKLKEQSLQLKYVKSITDKYQIDILSINELQYDIESVPNPNYKTKGQNLKTLVEILKLQDLKNLSFNPANTGMGAKTKSDGSYYTDPNSPAARLHADQFNFGTMPGQYSTGMASKFKIIKELVITDLQWREFNPAVDFSLFKTASGKKIPQEMKLFDKNFSDITLRIHNKDVHIILLHTVPAFNFGNKKSMNYLRNADQLRFLEWYLTGETDHKVELQKITPLNKHDYFLAMGDFNTDINDQLKEGSRVLKRLFSKSLPWISQDKMSFSNETDTYAPKPFRLMLDYIITSKNIKASGGTIVHPDFTRVELGCGNKKDAPTSEMKLIKYKEDDQNCHVFVNKEYLIFKKASDHYPIFGNFELH